MDKEEVLEETAETEAEAEEVEEAEENEEETEEEEPELDDEFEYDEDGNIIIPDVVYDESEDDYLEEGEEPEENAEEESEAETEDEKEQIEAKEEEKPDKATPEEKPEEETKPDPRDEEIKRLRKELDKHKAIEKNALKALGTDDEDTIAGLTKIAAEAEGKSVDEYNKKIEKEAREAEAKRAIRAQLFEAKMQNDLKELHAAYPETQKYKHITDMPPEILSEFGRCRDLGLSAKKAYAAANPDGIRSDTAQAVKVQAAHDSKAHLKSVVPKASKDTSVKMTKAELASWKDVFPHLSEKEIIKLYKDTK